MQKGAQPCSEEWKGSTELQVKLIGLPLSLFSPRLLKFICYLLIFNSNSISRYLTAKPFLLIFAVSLLYFITYFNNTLLNILAEIVDFVLVTHFS